MCCSDRHVGDLGNFQPDKTGRIILKLTDNVVSFQGTNNILNRAVVVSLDILLTLNNLLLRICRYCVVLHELVSVPNFVVGIFYINPRPT